MQELIQGYWLNFVLDGNPNGAGNDLFTGSVPARRGSSSSRRSPKCKTLSSPNTVTSGTSFPSSLSLSIQETGGEERSLQVIIIRRNILEEMDPLKLRPRILRLPRFL